MKQKLLETYLFQETRTIPLMDEFEGVGSFYGKPPYDKLIIHHFYMLTPIHLVVERVATPIASGETTISDLKNERSAGSRQFQTYIMRLLQNQKMVKHCKATGEIYHFNPPYRLIAQNSECRSGRFHHKWDCYAITGMYITTWDNTSKPWNEDL